MPLYKYGDKVKIKTNGTYKIGKVISVRGNVFDGYECTVKFDSPSIMPNEMDFPEGHLEPHENRLNVFGHWLDTDEVCPICRQKWFKMESPIFGKKEIWVDCLKCKKTKEQLMKEIGK